MVGRRWGRVCTEWERGGIGLEEGKEKIAESTSKPIINQWCFPTPPMAMQHGLGYISICGLYLESAGQVSGISRAGMYRKKTDIQNAYPSSCGYRYVPG